MKVYKFKDTDDFKIFGKIEMWHIITNTIPTQLFDAIKIATSRDHKMMLCLAEHPHELMEEYNFDSFNYVSIYPDGLTEVVDAFVVNKILSMEKNKQLDKMATSSSLGNVFDTNQVSRSNLYIKLNIMIEENKTETIWKLANNELKIVTIEEIKEVLSLSMNEVEKILKKYVYEKHTQGV